MTVALASRSRILPGRPYPLGATWDGEGVNFALFSANAEKVELCLFDADGQRETERIPLPELTDEVWHGYLPDGRPNMLYGYRVHGPYAPQAGHRFNAHKLLLDPYARALHGSFRWTDAHFGYRAGSGREDLSFDRRDNARFMPKCRVVETAFTWGDDRRPHVPWERTVIYEAHVRGFTMRHPAVPPHLRGTFAGLGQPEVIRYLRDLGVTSVELLPVHAFIDDRFLVKRGLSNYWGYNTLAFFAPEPRYMSQPALTEFKTMVKRLHDAGIEVILDVVYNHTAEGDEKGPTLSFRGIDNASYYLLDHDDRRRYLNVTGTGNALNLQHPRVLQMVMDSLRYWLMEMRVDGFRFDLATTLGREPHGFDPRGGFFDAVRQDPFLSRAKLIAEPWDIGPGGYQVGRYPPGWAEWNDRYRDTVRRFWRGNHGVLPELAARLTGSADLFEHNGRRPFSSINYVACHDGFTLADITAYERKHNEANGEGNRDGHSDNHSWNHGHEGPTDDPEIRALRERQKRNLLATLLVSQGTPMLLAGDEFGRSQHGNNNAYCQDNEINWIDWPGLDQDGRDLIAFTRTLIALRQAHPLLRFNRFFTGERNEELGVNDLTWLSPAGVAMQQDQWQDPHARCLGMVIDGRARSAPINRPGSDSVLLLVVNAHHDVVSFTLPEVAGGAEWLRLLDTNLPDVAEPEGFAFGDAYDVTGRSLLLFELKLEARTDPALRATVKALREVTEEAVRLETSAE